MHTDYCSNDTLGYNSEDSKLRYSSIKYSMELESQENKDYWVLKQTLHNKTQFTPLCGDNYMHNDSMTTIQ